ncbi:cell envelope integrity protein CreD [Leptospira levettii]|uniref:Cell envelope integrity protein CreD n=1 Tax=Leptospira levettii TaxID=2023178 RepID=A0AAW5UYF2_9LEPT|nr:cell envelope integrity protein CreD [Leptospira levettii]MCW7465072.1 cell envelope integrity protein CreD [Leptospira levettii]MCW7473905.1 cell envelope integrity protein CreD [Leptospira levettii]MCW7509812.1 cell envelope integrity protein CreD [Leptospira levettii]MCW7513562.1 cell envelope integrity protein CreD [Leptospira levettii]TGL08941.1 cell envelope integrity protein CreD [Leptospira levettii]
MSKLISSINLRLMILGVMIILFIIPLSMVGSLIEERNQSRLDAVSEVGEKWSQNQTFLGPILVIPYNIRIPKSGNAQSKEKWDYITEYAYFLPEDLSYQVGMVTEERKRGIYHIPLYTSKINAKGKFAPVKLTDFPLDTTYIYWDDVRVIVSVTDLKGLGGDLKLTWNGKEKTFTPGTKSNFFPSGMSLPIQLEENEGNSVFTMDVSLKGSDTFSIIPIGKKTKMMMESNWRDPSFNGNILPVDREIFDGGFRSLWETSYFSRSFPQVIHSLDDSILNSIHNSAFGVSLLIPVDHYLKLERSVKYGLLFIVTSFTLFFLMEVFGGILLHPIQYVLIGCAMVIFYVLNLSLSEHIGYLVSYMISSLSVTFLISYYAIHALKNKKKGIMTGVYYLFLYSFLYIILASEDQALLLGSITLFMILALVMHFTRKVNWYEFGMNIENK